MSVRSKTSEMSGAGLAVVGTMCLSLLLVIGTACWLAIDGKDTPEVIDRVLQGLLIGVPALLAKTFRDAGASGPSDDDPTPVELVQGPPVVTREVTAADLGGGDPGLTPRRRRE